MSGLHALQTTQWGVFRILSLYRLVFTGLFAYLLTCNTEQNGFWLFAASLWVKTPREVVVTWLQHGSTTLRTPSNDTVRVITDDSVIYSLMGSMVSRRDGILSGSIVGGRLSSSGLLMLLILMIMMLASNDNTPSATVLNATSPPLHTRPAGRPTVMYSVNRLTYLLTYLLT